MVDTGSVVMTGISTSGAVYYADAGIPSGPNWKLLSGTVQQLSGGNGRMIGVNRTSGTVWYSSNQIVLNNTGVAVGANWLQVSGTTLNLKHVSLDWPAVYAIDNANKIIYADNIDNNTSGIGWNLLPGVTGTFKLIAAKQGRGCAIGTDDNIYYIDNTMKSGAKNVMGTLAAGTIAHLSFDGKIVAAVDKSNKVYISRNIEAATPTWTLINGSVKQISIQNGMAVCIGSDNAAYFTPDLSVTPLPWISMNAPSGITLQQIEIYTPADRNTRVTRFPNVTSCKSGFNNVNGVCTPGCQPGYTQSGTNCIPPDIPRIQRTTEAVSAPFNTCPAGFDLIGDKCYGACPTGFTVTSGDPSTCSAGNVALPPPMATKSQTIECNDEQALKASPLNPTVLRSYNRFVGSPNSQTCRQECDYGYTYSASSGMCIGGPDTQNVDGKAHPQVPQIAVCNTKSDYPVSEGSKCYGKKSCPANYIRRGDNCVGPTYTPDKVAAGIIKRSGYIPDSFCAKGEGVIDRGCYNSCEKMGAGYVAEAVWPSTPTPQCVNASGQRLNRAPSNTPDGSGFGCPIGFDNVAMTSNGPKCSRVCATGETTLIGGQCKKPDIAAISVPAAIPGPPCAAGEIKDDTTVMCYTKLVDYRPITFQSTTPIPAACDPDRTLLRGQCHAKCEEGKTTIYSSGTAAQIALLAAVDAATTEAAYYKLLGDLSAIVPGLADVVASLNATVLEITNITQQYGIKITELNNIRQQNPFSNRIPILSAEVTRLNEAYSVKDREQGDVRIKRDLLLDPIRSAVPKSCTSGTQPRPTATAIVNNSTTASRYSNETCQSEVYGIKGYAYTRESAAAKCASYGAVLATTAQLADAKAAGANWCSNGWLSDSGTPTCPVTPPNTCNWPAAAGNLYAANCFGPKPNNGVYTDIQNFNDVVWNRPNIICYQKCPAGTTEKATTCSPAPVPIPTGQYTPTIACNQGEELVNGKCVSSCPDGTYPDGNICSSRKQIVSPPSSIKCISTKFGAVNKWLCDSQDDANALINGKSKNIGYANPDDQICVSDDPTTAMYFCQTLTEALNESTTSANIQNNYKATCGTLMKTYMDLSNNLMNLNVIRASITDGSTTLEAATTGLNSVYTQLKCTTAPANSQIQTLCTQIQQGMNTISADSTTVKAQLDRFISTITSLLDARSNLHASIDTVCATQKEQSNLVATIRAADI